jgi:hypothetical protein
MRAHLVLGIWCRWKVRRNKFLCNTHALNLTISPFSQLASRWFVSLKSCRDLS